MKNYYQRLSFLVLLALALSVNTASAGGYAILEQSAEGVGTAFAGSVTGYSDGSAAFFNPAALTQHNKTTISGGAHAVITSADFTNTGSTVSGFPNRGSNGPDGGDTGIVPNFYVVQPVSEKLVTAFMVNAPFGLKTEYDRTWVGRYQAVKSDLSTINLGSAVAYEITDQFSVGARGGAFYTSAELTNAIDFGSVAYGALGAETASALGFVPQGNDGFLALEGEDWSPNWGLGGTFRFGPSNRNTIGIAYASKSDVHLHGKQANFEVPTSALALTSMGTFTDTGARANTTLPESVTFGASYWVTDCVELLYESQWTRWGRFKELRIKYDNQAQPDSVVDENWENTWRHSVGARYLPGGSWDFSGGIAYDQEPIPDDNHRTPRIPGNDRFWLAAGLGYSINDDLRLALNYAHLFIDDARSNTTGPTGDVFQGEWDLGVDIVAASLTYSWS
ncbi:MAG: outer membrane protein transport protein [Bdellovibrionales bacterium]|nr:outer membrane protein transport protein [Bdellovibrionales bacterium]